MNYGNCGVPGSQHSMRIKDYWPTLSYIGMMLAVIGLGAYEWPTGYGRLALGLAVASLFATGAIFYVNRMAVDSEGAP